MKQLKNINEVALFSVRHTWSHEVNPVTKVFKSKKSYNRKDKSWQKEY